MQEIIVYKAVVCTTVFLVVKELVEILGEVQMGKQCAYQMAPSSTCLINISPHLFFSPRHLKNRQKNAIIIKIYRRLFSACRLEINGKTVGKV